MRLHHSNRMEALAAGLADLMRGDPLPPLESERVVVPHPNVGRWLSLELARALGVAAHLRFEQPAEFAWSIMRGAAPDLPREQPYAPAQLRWRIHDLLPRRPGEPAGGALHGYLRDGDPRARFELADRLARFFDRCLLYRPDWVREWDRGALPHWQAGLWRRLREADGPAGSPHWVGAVDAFRAALAGGREARGGPPADPRRAGTPGEAPEGPRAGAPSSEAPAARWPPPAWPRRASFFAVPALSPSYLEMLCEAARGIDLHVFLLNPCREYWGEVRSRREIARRARGADPRDRYLSEGNELLAAWGRAGRDTFDAFLEVADAESEERFVAPAGARRLAALQRDVLDLRLADEAAGAARRGTAAEPGAPPSGGPGGAPPAERPPAARGRRPDPPPADDSLQIHVCHSPLREAEVLHDRLLALFDAHRDLEPAHVLVLTPELGVYGPAIEAVFGAAGSIPCHVARAPAARSRALRAFLDVLALPGSRYGADSVLAPLAAPALRARFGIGETALPALRGLVREAGVRFCVDEAHREGEGLPATAEHTWRQGLRRLLLGYAMGDTDTLVAGLAPGPAVAATGGGALRAEVDAETLGRFLTYCEAAFALRGRLAGERRPAQWAETLRQVADTFFAGAAPPRGQGGAAPARPDADERVALRELIRDFTRESAGGASPVRFEVVRDVLREHAGESARASLRLADGVCVASLAPGRVFPAEVVCVAGMNDGVFPRSPSFPSFDLVAAGPARRGDRDVRHEDRFAFLEALLAARRVFLVSYTGRGLRDDAALPPSVLVDELRDYLGRRFPGVEFETRHPLQPFSPRYFAAPEGMAEPRGDAAPDAPEAASAADGGTGGAGGNAAPGDAPDGARERKGARAARGGAASAGAAPGRGPGPPREGEGLFSYSLGMCEAARAMLAGPEAAGAPERFAAPLPEPEESRRRVTLTELVAFFANPARAFLRDRLGVRLEVENLAVDTEEPFEVEGLERYRLRSETWEQVRAGTAAERGAALLRGRGRLPHANLGRVVHERTREEAEELAARLAPYRAALEAPPREIDLALGGFHLVGTIDHFAPAAGASGEDAPAAGATREDGPGAERPDGADSGGAGPGLMLWWRIGSLRARDRVEIGLRQLAWAAAGHTPAGALGVSLERGSWKRTRFPPPERASERLEAWLRAWWRGLSAPLPFFPETSLAYARSIARPAEAGGGAREAALAKARECWFGDRYRRGECLDPYLALAHDEGDPLSGAFEDLARALLAPLLEDGR